MKSRERFHVTHPSLSVVIPVYNEEAGLPALFARLYPALDALRVPYEVIFVNDGSRDRSAAVLKDQFAARPDVTRVILFNANYGQHLAILAGFERVRGERIVTLDADLSKSTMTVGFARKFPERAFNIGIAESNMVGVGAGLALTGRIPFVCSFACFVVGRFETIRISVAYTSANVKIVGTHAGIAIGEDGYSQMGLEDIACLRALPNVTIVQPADELETKQAVAWAVEHQGPVYLRLTRQNLEPVCPPDSRFQLGRWLSLRQGRDVTVIASGGTVFNALCAATQLEADGISAEVINAASIKPLDESLLARSAARTRHVVTVEDHSIHGGLGGAVAEALSEMLPTPVKRLGVTGFGESGDAAGLYARHGLDPAGIAASIKKFLTR